MPNFASNTFSVLGGAALGAIAAYFLDPDHGSDRRNQIMNTANDAVARAGDSAKHMVGTLGDYADQVASQVGKHANAVSDGAHGAADQAHRELSSSIQSLIERAKEFAADLGDRGQATAADVSNRAKKSISRQTGWEPARSHSVGGITTGTIGALALGAGAMFFFDPARGRARRAWATEKISSWTRRGTKSATRYGRHVGNQVKGAVAEAKQAMPQDWSKTADRAAGAVADIANKTSEQPEPT